MIEVSGYSALLVFSSRSGAGQSPSNTFSVLLSVVRRHVPIVLYGACVIPKWQWTDIVPDTVYLTVSLFNHILSHLVIMFAKKKIEFFSANMFY